MRSSPFSGQTPGRSRDRAGAPATAPVSVDGLAVRYGRQQVLADLRLRVDEGEVYALLGRNGAGKSSLLRCLLGLQRPQAGRCSVMGLDPWAERSRLMEQVAAVHEDPQTPPQVTAAELLAFHGRFEPAWDVAGAAERLARLRVPLDVPAGRLSKGQRKQVDLALALARRPRLLVLDDPSLGLDPVARRELFGEVIAELTDRGITVLLTTHDLDAAERLADRVGILHGGRLAFEGSVEQLAALSEAAGSPARGGRPRLEELVTAVLGGAGASEEAAS